MLYQIFSECFQLQENHSFTFTGILRSAALCVLSTNRISKTRCYCRYSAHKATFGCESGSDSETD